MNTFFSGSVKGLYTLPFWYPGNSAYYLNGTLIDPNTASSSDVGLDIVYGMEGFVDSN
jgi:hypothetical protein